MITHQFWSGYWKILNKNFCDRPITALDGKVNSTLLFRRVTLLKFMRIMRHR